MGRAQSATALSLRGAPCRRQDHLRHARNGVSMARRKFLCFVHVERAGGTTLQRLLLNLFPTYLSLKPWYCWANEPENCFVPAELAAVWNRVRRLSASLRW